MLLISSADHYIGHCVTSHLARYTHLRSRIRVLCENKTPCLNFAKKGIDVRQVNYMHPDDLAQAMRGVDHLILAVGNERDRSLYCQHLCQVASRSDVKSIICISHVGAMSFTHEALQHYATIEDAVISTDCQWTILRPDWLHQNFHLWASYVDRHRRLPLPLPLDAELCPIDITDLCRVVEQLVLEVSGPVDIRPCLQDEHAGQVYTLTGPQAVNIKELIQTLNTTTGYGKLEYQYVRPMDTLYYLNNLPKDIWFDARLKQESREMYHDSLDGFAYRTRVFAAPTETQIRTLIDYFDWVHQTSSSVYVPHASAITCLPLRPLRKFFKENANSFKPRV